MRLSGPRYDGVSPCKTLYARMVNGDLELDYNPMTVGSHLLDVLCRLASVAETNRVMTADEKAEKSSKRKSSGAVDPKKDPKFEVS